MTINHGCAIALEAMVCKLWGLNGAPHLYTRIDADWFEYHPFDAAIFLLAPYVIRDYSVDQDSFVRTTLSFLSGLCNEEISSPEMESKFMDEIISLNTYLSQHYTPAK